MIKPQDMPPLPKAAEWDVRRLRDAVCGHKTTDRNWDACKERWMRFESVKWLLEHTSYRP